MNVYCVSGIKFYFNLYPVEIRTTITMFGFVISKLTSCRISNLVETLLADEHLKNYVNPRNPTNEIHTSCRDIERATTIFYII